MMIHPFSSIGLEGQRDTLLSYSTLTRSRAKENGRRPRFGLSARHERCIVPQVPYNAGNSVIGEDLQVSQAATDSRKPGIPSQARIFTILAFGLVAISLGSILVRYSQEAPSLVISFYRMLWATLFTAPFYFLRSKRGLTGSWKIQLLAGLALALHFAFWISSLRYTSVAVSVLLVNSSPVLVAAASFFVFKERVTVRGLLGILTCFLGSAVLLGNDLLQLGDWRGALLAILGAAMLGIYLIVGRHIRQDRPLLDYVFPTYFVAAVVLLGLTLLSGDPLTGFSPNTYLFLMLLGLIPQCLGHTSYNWALEYLPATMISTLILAEPILASLFAWWLLGEGITLGVAAGALLVGGGILLVTRWGFAAPVAAVEISLCLLKSKGRVWIQFRENTGHLDGYWEFPGGKVEEGETSRAAAVRELREECGITISPDRLSPFQVVEHDYPERRVRLHCFTVELEASVTPSGRTGRWVPIVELPSVRFPAANEPIVRALIETGTGSSS